MAIDPLKLLLLLLSNINLNKAMGPDKIHGRILRSCALPLSKPLSYLFTKSYYGMSIPDEWKAASVVPVHKKGSKSDVQNYRPISLTCIIMKVMERIVRDELMARCGLLFLRVLIGIKLLNNSFIV